MCPQQPHDLSEHLVPRKITEALMIGHSDLLIVPGHLHCQCPTIPRMMQKHLIVLEI